MCGVWKMPRKYPFRFLLFTIAALLLHDIIQLTSVNDIYAATNNFISPRTIITADDINDAFDTFLSSNAVQNNDSLTFTIANSERFGLKVIVYYSLKTQTKYLLYSTYETWGNGNFVLHYYYYRAIAYFLNLNFIWLKYGISKEYNTAIDREIWRNFEIYSTDEYFRKLLHRLKYVTQKGVPQNETSELLIDSINNTNHILHHLRPWSKQTFLKTINYDLRIYKKMEATQLFLWQQILAHYSDKHSHAWNDMRKYAFDERNTDFFFEMVRFPWNGNYSHKLYANTVYLQTVLQPEMNEILDYKLSNIDRNEYVFNEFDLVLHIRCGDIIVDRVEHNGFFQLRELDSILRYITDNYGTDTTAVNTAYVMMNILDSDSSFDSLNSYARNHLDHHVQCRTLWNLIESCLQNIFASFNYAQMRLIDRGSLNSDIYMLSHAPFVVCFMSTFCEAGLMANQRLKKGWNQKFIEASLNEKLLFWDPKHRTTLQINGESQWNIADLSDYMTGNEGNICNFLHIRGPDQWSGFATAIFIYPMSFLQLAQERHLKLWIDYTNEFNDYWYDKDAFGTNENFFEYYYEGFTPQSQGCAKKSNFKIVTDIPKKHIYSIHANLNYIQTWYYAWNPTRMAPKLMEKVFPNLKNAGNHQKWENYTITYYDWFYRKYRKMGFEYRRKYLKLKAEIMREFEAMYAGLGIAMHGNSVILGVHMRGSDKIAVEGNTRRAVPPNEYYPYIKAFIKYYNSENSENEKNIYVLFATDDSKYLRQLKADWKTHISESESFEKIVKYQRNILRSNNETNAFDFKQISKFELGKQILFDVLLLAKADYFIHAASAIAESVFYHNFALHNHSVHLEYVINRNEPVWFSSERTIEFENE